MAKKRLLTSSGGGIAPGSPFVVNQALFVQQVSPPFAKSGRLGQLADVMLSLVAPSAGGAAGSFVMGEGSDMGAQPKVTVIGKNIKGNGAVASARWVAIGGNLDLSAAAGGNDNNVLIGWDMVFGTPTNTNNNAFVGHALTTTNAVSGAAALGNDITLRGGDSVVVGDLGNSDGEGTAVGKNSFSGVQAQALGKQAHAGGAKAIAIGFLTQANQDNQISIGPGINATAFVAAVRIGRNAEVFEDNSWSLGGDPADGTEMRVLRLGPNTLSGYPGLSIFLPSTGAGNNLAGPTTTIRGGISTGDKVKGGKISFQTSTPVASGGTYQPIKEVFRIQSGGAVGAPTIAFVNQVVNAGAVLATKTLEVEINGVVEQLLVA